MKKSDLTGAAYKNAEKTRYFSQNLVRQYPSYKHKTNGTTAMLRNETFLILNLENNYRF